MRKESKVCRDCQRLLGIECFRRAGSKGSSKGWKSVCEECLKRERDAGFADREKRRAERQAAES